MTSKCTFYKSLFQLFKESKQNTTLICDKLESSNNYKCRFRHGTEMDLLKNGATYEGIYSKDAIENFFGEIGAVKCESKHDTRVSDVNKWIIMNNDIDKIHTFGDDSEFHINRKFLPKFEIKF